MNYDQLIAQLEKIKTQEEFVLVVRRCSTSFYIIEIETKERMINYKEADRLHELMDENNWEAPFCKRLRVTNPDHPEFGRPYLEIDSVYLTRQQADRIFIQ